MSQEILNPYMGHQKLCTVFVMHTPEQEGVAEQQLAYAHLLLRSHRLNMGITPSLKSSRLKKFPFVKERRHRERQSASQLGAEMMDTFGAGEDPSSSNMPATTSFTDLEDPGLQDTSTSQPGWQPSGICKSLSAHNCLLRQALE